MQLPPFFHFTAQRMSNLSARIGSTSYVYPGDLVHNATWLARDPRATVQDMELVLFVTSTGLHNLPTAAEIAQLARIGSEAGMTYTVHLPRDLRGDGGDGGESLALAQQVIALCAPLAPHAYVMHIESEGAGSAAWTAQAINALTRVVAWVGDPNLVALENLESYAPQLLEPLFAALPIARTLDIGHLWKAGIDPLTMIDQWRDHSRVMHLHGVRAQDGAMVDHGTLAWIATPLLAEVLTRLQGWRGVLTLEVFEDDFFTSRTALNDALTVVDTQTAHVDARRPT
jgi:sugar phosphate isomerase/epimerase